MLKLEIKPTFFQLSSLYVASCERGLWLHPHCREEGSQLTKKRERALDCPPFTLEATQEASVCNGKVAYHTRDNLDVHCQQKRDQCGVS